LPLIPWERETLHLCDAGVRRQQTNHGNGQQSQPQQRFRLRYLAGLDSEHSRTAAHELELSEEERALLRDPEWMDEDEADAIMAMRIEKEEAGSAIPIRQYMHERAARSRTTK